MGINAFSLAYTCFYLPFSFVSVYLTERFGSRWCITTGAAANLICCWVRYGGSMIGDENLYARYAVVLFGQIIAASAQPLLLNSPPRLVNDWFPPKERDMAIWITTMANVIGNALGCIVPAYQVVVAADIPNMLLWQAIGATCILAITLVFFRSSTPPTPPSADVEIQLRLRAADKVTASSKAYQALLQNLTDTRAVLRNGQFVAILASFSIEVGMAWSFLTVAAQMIYPCR